MDGFYANFSNFMMGISLMFFLVMSISLFPYRKKNNMMLILFWSIVLIVLQGIKDMLLLVPGIDENNAVARIIIILDGIFIPVIGLFLFESVAPGWVTPRKAFWFVFPVIVVTSVYVFFPFDWILYLYFTYVVVFGLALFVSVLLGTSLKDNWIKSFVFNDLSRPNLWVRRATTVLFSILFLWLALVFFGHKYTDVVYFFSSILAWSYIYALLYKNVLQEKVSVEVCTPDLTQTASSYDIEEIRVEGSLYKKRFVESMETEKLFLNPMLSLKEVAAHIGTNRTYLSAYINRYNCQK